MRGGIAYPRIRDKAVARIIGQFGGLSFDMRALRAEGGQSGQIKM